MAPKTYSDFTNIKTLEKLAGVKGGDVTFNQNGSITIKEQSPITVNATGDKLNVTTQGNTFISGTNDTKFNVNTPINAGDGKVVLMTGNGIDADKGITAKDIELYAGAGDINITADANLPVKNITSVSNVNVNAKGNIIPADEDTRVKAPNVNLTSSKNIATRANPLNINADNTALKAKYAYILGDYGNLNAVGTNVESLNKASGGEENSTGNNSSAFWLSTNQPTITDESSNTKSRYGLLHAIRVVNSEAPATPVRTAQNSDFYKMALALSKSSTLMNKSGAAYDAAAKAWLNGMGYSEAEEKKIIDLSLEIAFDNRLLTGGIADIINRTLRGAGIEIKK